MVILLADRWPYIREHCEVVLYTPLARLIASRKMEHFFWMVAWRIKEMGWQCGASRRWSVTAIIQLNEMTRKCLLSCVKATCSLSAPFKAAMSTSCVALEVELWEEDNWKYLSM